ncbi:MAG: acetate--CoA ligase family protein [Desulfamplus sp.]|nr:acetate--CoA ligase family protein [Desulfamplus sp.]
MKLYVKLDNIRQLFDRAANEGRDYLFEYEVYELISLSGGETPLKCLFLDKDARLDDEIIAAIPGDKVVIKIVSPSIVHKSDAGGVKIVNKTKTDILSAIRGMMYEVPERQSAIVIKNRGNQNLEGQNFDQEELARQIHSEIKGVMISEFLPPDGSDFGNELLVSLRRTREFGMVLTAGLGGTNTELYAQRFRFGEAVVSASTEMLNAETFFNLYKKTISFDKLTGIGRGEKRKVTDEQLKECFAAMIEVANHFSPLNPDAPYIIEELEINPFAFHRYLMVPLDGLCRFSTRQPLLPKRPISKIDKMLHPESIAIIGVSAKSLNPGRIILQNIIANGFDRKNLSVVHQNSANIKVIEGIPTFSSIFDLKAKRGKVDLFILAVASSMVQELIDELIENGAVHSVIMIAGGVGEVSGSEEKGALIERKIKDAGSQDMSDDNSRAIFLGGNSLGILSHPGRYDSIFITEDKLPKTRGNYIRNTAFISQSGGYMITRMSKLSFMDPAYAISIGNQIDLTAGDIMHHFSSLSDITTIASYMEGFKELDGLEFARAVRDAVRKRKEIIFYKAGRTPEGKSATSGHTASLAGDYTVCKSCISEAGAMVANTFTEFEGLIMLSKALNSKKIAGNRLAAISNAGYESVGIADNILGDEFKIEMAKLSLKTKMAIQETIQGAGLADLVDIKNPMDVTPMAGEEVYEAVIEALLNDNAVDAVVAAIVPLTPVLSTLCVQSLDGVIKNNGEKDTNRCYSDTTIIKRISNLAKQYAKPLVVVVDSGELYDPLSKALQNESLAVFRSADQAVYALGKYIKGRLKAEKIALNRP